jgi:hypothetical protein
MSIALMSQPLPSAAVVDREGHHVEHALDLDAQVRLFAAVLHGGEADGLVEVAAGRREPDGALRMRARDQAPNYIPIEDLGALVARVAHHRERGLEVFVGPVPRTDPRGRKDAAADSHLAWIDIDRPGELHRLWRFAHPPHLVVASGSGGAHAYWRLAEPLPAQPLEGRWIERANLRLAYHLAGDRASVDRARVMRVPGSVNHKVGRLCHIRYADPRRPGYQARELLGSLPEPPVSWLGRRVNSRPAGGWSGRRSNDPLRAIAPREYFRALAAAEVTRDGYCHCPLPDHEDPHPSCRVFETAEEGWWCFGCGRGGSIYDLASLLEGGPGGGDLRGEAFVRAKRVAYRALRAKPDRPPSFARVS